MYSGASAFMVEAQHIAKKELLWLLRLMFLIIMASYLFLMFFPYFTQISYWPSKFSHFRVTILLLLWLLLYSSHSNSNSLNLNLTLTSQTLSLNLTLKGKTTFVEVWVV